MNRFKLFSPRWTVALAIFSVACAVRAARADSADDWARMKVITPKGYVCCRADNPPRIDGRLDDAAWQAVPWTDDFVDIEGDGKPPPRFRTRAKMAWDGKYFYIAAELEEPHIWGTLTKHDSVIFHDNDFEFFIDPDGDNHEYYEFEINALNTGWDLFLPRPYKDGGRAHDAWEIPGLVTAVHVDGTFNNPADNDQRWSVEIAVPWQALRDFAHRPVPPRDGDQWRINFSRVEWQHEIKEGKYQKVPGAREDNWVWSPQGIVDMHRPERWGYVQFSTAAPGKASFIPDPTQNARNTLLTIYHHQHAFRQKHQRWANSLDELGLAADQWSGLPKPPVLVVRDGGWRAMLVVPLAGEELRAWSIRHDSRLRPVSPIDDLSDTIEGILTEQAEAWNAGDIDRFMQHYWKSDELTFSSSGMISRGWETTKENYKKRYPTKERMGNLSFGAIEVTRLGDSSALVLGRWHLQREPAPVGGNFSLVFQRIDRAWVIVHDHTSQDKPVSTEQPQPVAAALDRAAVKSLEMYLAVERNDRRPLQREPFANIPLTRDDAARCEKLLWLDHAAHIRQSRAAEMSDRVLTDGELKMPFHYEIFGDKPAGGRSLYISMHGGGGAPKQVNDRQWENQKKLYRLEEGIYVAPRAPTDTWNLWHQDHIDRLFGRLFEDLIVFEDVNPDRVYLMGYSAGGDGVYQLAPRMADRWAAAAMMAGHPNETSPLGLRNVAFTIHVGGRDGAFDRNQVARDWGQKLAELRKADPEGYVYLVKIYPDKGHWLDREDAAAIPWMAQYRRNPFPTRIVWKQDDVTHSRFYWLAVPPNSTRDRAEVTALRKGQEIVVTASGVDTLTIRMNDAMFELDQPLAVNLGGKQLFAGKVPRTIGVLARTLEEYGDPRSVFSGELTIELPKAP